MEDLYRYQYVFSGQVQGVGFRYTAFKAATSCKVTGWVQNQWNGTVLMEAQGTSAQLAKLLKTISIGMFIQIDNIEKKQLPVDPTESSFQIH